MKYEDFEKFVREKCMYETIYDDSDGYKILIIRLLDAYSMLNKKEWVGFTQEEHQAAIWTDGSYGAGFLYAEKLLKEKNV